MRPPAGGALQQVAPPAGGALEAHLDPECLRERRTSGPITTPFAPWRSRRLTAAGSSAPPLFSSGTFWSCRLCSGLLTILRGSKSSLDTLGALARSFGMGVHTMLLCWVVWQLLSRDTRLTWTDWAMISKISFVCGWIIGLFCLLSPTIQTNLQVLFFLCRSSVFVLLY